MNYRLVLKGSWSEADMAPLANYCTEPQWYLSLVDRNCSDAQNMEVAPIFMHLCSEISFCHCLEKSVIEKRVCLLQSTSALMKLQELQCRPEPKMTFLLIQMFGSYHPPAYMSICCWCKPANICWALLHGLWMCTFFCRPLLICCLKAKSLFCLTLSSSLHIFTVLTEKYNSY